MVSAPWTPVLTATLAITGVPFSNTVRASGSCLDTNTYVYGAASTRWAARSANSAVQTRRPANPSAARPCWFSKAITAPLVMTFSDPSVHWEVRSGGVPGQRQLNIPGWAVAASIGEGSAPAEVKDSGR